MADVLPLRIAAPVPPPRKRRRKFSPLVVDAKRLAKLLCVGLRTIRTMDAAGKIPRPIRLAGVRWKVREIRDWIDAGAPTRDEWEERTASRLK